MKRVDYCIIGGGIAGTTAAETIRSLDDKGSILIISEEPYTLYSRVMLSKAHYILKESSTDRAFLRTVEQYKSQNIEILTGERADRVVSEKKIVQLGSGTSINYKKLLIATGGKAMIPDYIKKSYKNVFALQNIDDAKQIIEKLEKARNVIVVGSGFISFEMASILAKVGKKVTICMRGGRFWRNVLHAEASDIIESALIKEGAVIIKESEVKEFLGEEYLEGVILSSGYTLPCDLFVYGIGTNYHQDWVESANIRQNNGIIINKYLQTSNDSIWAAGDVAEYPELITKEVSMPGNWANAQVQGKYVGEAMVEEKSEPFSHISSYTSSGCGLTVCFIGDTRRNIVDKTVIRGTKKDYPKFGELFIKNDKLVGAILINRGNEIMPLREMIIKKILVSKIEKKLRDSKSDLKSI